MTVETGFTLGVAIGVGTILCAAYVCIATI